MEGDGPDIAGWALTPAGEALGKLVVDYPARFGRSLLTTNFDPLIEVAIRRAGGNCFRTTLHSDGNFSQTEGDGCHVIHLHGYWYGSDTLHTTRQLSQVRPQLRASIASLLREKLVVVCGYGGWDDAFTTALMEVARDDTAYPEIIWTFYSDKPVVSDRLSSTLSPGIDRGRVNLYSGIDCHQFFATLHEVWCEIDAPKSSPSAIRSNPVRISSALSEAVEAHRNLPTFLEGDDEDRPPVVDICVGREDDLRSIKMSDAKVIFVTGLGGQGKSTVAARYFTDRQQDKSFSVFVWRDCKEESERFESQLSSIVEKLSKGKISGSDLAKQSAASIIEILLSLIKDINILCVFDNVDHYVNLETRRMTGNTNLFVEALLRSDVRSRIVFTCRPSVYYDHPLALSCPLSGLDLQATLRLFAERGARSSSDDIEDAHRLTDGHAFWLDLLAVQVAKKTAAIGLKSLVDEIRSGGGLLPTKTLKSVWATLKDREQVVLRALAETVKPDTEADIGEYLRGALNYNRVIRALTALRALNLVVIKRRPGGTDLLELHPLVRQFVHNTFPRPERISYINGIIQAYQRFIGTHKSRLAERPALSILQYWTQNADLDITAHRFNDAFLTLAEASTAFAASAYPPRVR